MEEPPEAHVFIGMKKIGILIGIVLLALAAYFLFSQYFASKLTGRTVLHIPAPRVETKPVQILFVGDMMLDRTVRTSIDAKGLEYLLTDVRPIFEDNDLVIGNLEGSVTSNPSVSAKDYSVLRFTFDPSVLEELKKFGFSGFSLANNHALDFGKEGFLETQANISRSDLFSFGSPLNDLNLSAEARIEDEKLCFVGYHSLFDEDTDPVTAEIARIRSKCTYITVFAHWGNEYEDNESAAQQQRAHEFIDSGADLIIGAHPHVVQPIEIYKNKAIFYSLGNFIFDQDFSLATRQGLAIRLELSSSTAAFRLIPVEMRKAELYLPEAEHYRRMLTVLTSKLPSEKAATIRTDMTLLLLR